MGDGEWQVSGGFHWLYMYEDGINIPNEFNLIDFKGGLYADVTDIDQQDNTEAMKIRDTILESHNLEKDKTRSEMGNIITSPNGKNVLGYSQMDYWTPIKHKNNCKII